MSENQPPPPPGGYDGPPPPPQPGGYPGQPAAGVPRPGELQNRFLARLIDFFIVWVVIGIAYFVLSAIFLGGLTNSFGELFLFWTLEAIVAAVIPVAYFALMESNSGQTVGKMVLKLKTFGPDGVNKPTMQEAVKRNAFAGLYILGIIPFIGWFFLFWAAPAAAAIYIALTLNKDVPNHQGWHDRFAGGTRVMQIA